MAISRDTLRDMLERSRFAIRWGGALGLLCHPIYYVIWTYVLPQPYDNLWLRLSAAAVCIPLLFQARWPKRYNHYLLIYWHCCLIYVLPFVCTFLTVRNGFSTMWMMTEVMMIFILALCIDSPWLLMACIGVGVFAGGFAAVLSASEPIVLSADDKSNLALLPVVVLCSMAFSHAISKGRIFVEKNRALQALAGSIAHEMRNPLSQLRHVLDRVEEALPATTEPGAAPTLSEGTTSLLYNHVAQGQLSIERGLRIIAMTLDEVSAKSIRADSLGYLHAGATTRKALDEYGFDNDKERAKVSLVIKRDFAFRGDETVYLFTLFNLIKNALYHIAPHPQATLTLTVDHGAVSVRDTGPGIAPEIVQHLFEPFRTAGNSSGTGLGLAYCQRTMRAFGGSIDCQSELGKFTEFTLRFPPVSADELAQHERRLFERAMPAFKGKRVLVVDDDNTLRARTRHVLTKAGAYVSEAASGELALATLRRATPYDLVLMDISMPELDGYATTERIRAERDNPNRNVLIVAYTAEPGNAVRLRARRAGMDEIISKASNVQELITAVQTLFENGARHDPDGQHDGFVGKTIVIADDDTYSRLVAKTYLERCGATVLEAEHGQAVLTRLREDGFIAAILMDVNMPGMNGIETTRAIRARSDAYATVPIVALTSHSDAEAVQACLAAGMNEVMIKPVQPGPLHACLARQFGTRNAAAVAAAGHVEAAVAAEAAVAKASGTASVATSAATGAGLAKQADFAVTPVALAGSSASTSTTAPLTFTDDDLLDTDHLEELATLDLLDESFVDGIAQIRSHTARLAADSAAADIKAAHTTLHALLGVSGNLGAQALHRYARQLYPRVIAGEWPQPGDWLAQLSALSARSTDALQRYYSTAKARRDHRDALSD
ncbi:hybrid sensor histidine kinase/response regulator [Burkholderia sp. SRS-W-2-2016]|uniref:ATP-binding response regulator n=1 Tax=Burkholderia sp. SRS-W-2-2016 TaxID=1926878 RepID=UPI00094ADE46|nr:hybrid sensor histidine kinase/response regulator [Burkholderia sp. SRS-W-2-2016]OLL28992.1 hybrid sensor histidine kinase/response regulator [Burkholderia sp. SRS-W-2-2016]